MLTDIKKLLSEEEISNVIRNCGIGRTKNNIHMFNVDIFINTAIKLITQKGLQIGPVKIIEKNGK